MIIKRQSVLKIKNFLSPQENQAILDYAIDNQNNFQPTSVTTKVDDYRRSQVLHKFPNQETFINKLRYFLPVVTDSLGLRICDFDKIESQLTTHQNQDFFKLHNDNDGKLCESRVITYVYYFHKQPKCFSGGELLIYDTKVKKNPEPATNFKIIYPNNNCLIFFESKCFHEVLTTRVPSKSFEDGRFTINGWIHKFNPENLQPSLAILP